MSFITTKFHEVLLIGFRGVALTNCFSSIFHFRQFLSSKRALLQEKKFESKFLVDMQIYTLWPSILQSFTKFCWAVSEELRWQTVLSSIFYFGQISKFKMGVTPRKKINSNFSCGYADLHIMSFITTKFHEILFQRCQSSCADKKNRTDGLTDWQLKNIIPSATCCVGYN